MDKAIETSKNLENVQQYVDFVKENLQPLADHLKVGIDWLWQILVMQARVEAITLLIICVIMSTLGLSLLISFFYNMKRAEWDGYGGAENRHGVLAWITGIGAGLMLVINVIALPANLPTIVTGLVNPEFRAIEKIVEFAKPNVEKVSEEVK